MGKMKYSLELSDQKSLKISLRNLHNNWQADVTERLVGNYIKGVLIPALKLQGWNEAIYTNDSGFQIFYDENESLRPTHRQGIWNNVVCGFFIKNDLYPSEELMSSLKKLVSLLKHTPDGYLFKLNKTGQIKSLKRINDSDSEQLPVVNGEIEVVEVKSGKARLSIGQKEDYSNAINEKFFLRFYKVDVISFENNVFEIEERLFANVGELNASQHSKSS